MKPAVEQVVTKIGDFIEYWGFKKVHGEIWALAFLTGRPIDANYIIVKLKISKSLVSMSIKDLLNYNVLKVSEQKYSTIHYEVNPNITDVICDILKTREKNLLNEIKKSCHNLQSKTSNDVSFERVKLLNDIVCSAEQNLNSFLKFKSISLASLSKFLNIGNRNG